MEPMSDPYLIKTCGHTFNKSTIESCAARTSQCPLCRKSFKLASDIVPNYAVRDIIEQNRK